MKTTGKFIAIFIGVISLLFTLELVGLGFFKFFEPKRENIRREIFEETKSYTHGKIQDLAKYYGEWTKAESLEDKESIEQIIKMQFAEFDAENIKVPKLKQFLTNTRGY